MNPDHVAVLQRDEYEEALKEIIALSKKPIRRRLTPSHGETNGNDWRLTAKQMVAIATEALKAGP